MGFNGNLGWFNNICRFRMFHSNKVKHPYKLRSNKFEKKIQILIYIYSFIYRGNEALRASLCSSATVVAIFIVIFFSLEIDKFRVVELVIDYPELNHSSAKLQRVKISYPCNDLCKCITYDIEFMYCNHI